MFDSVQLSSQSDKSVGTGLPASKVGVVVDDGNVRMEMMSLEA